MTTYNWITALIEAHWATRHSPRHERGEGVISAAIVVLIMALLGAAMWFSFNSIWTQTETKTQQNVSSIGS